MRRTLPLLAVFLAASLTMTAGHAEDTDRIGLISIQGHGEVTATPDTAVVSSGVTTQGATAREALDANTEAMAALIAALGEAGIEGRDIQTSNFTVAPNYVYSDQRTTDGYTLPPQIQGYTVSNNVNARVRDLDKLGVVLDRAVTVGANTIGGISFSVDDPSELYDEARAAALKDAIAKADLYASNAGFSVGAIRSLTEGMSGGMPPQPFANQEMRAMVASSPAVPVQAGEMVFAIDVSVVWEIQNIKNNLNIDF